MTIPSSQYPDHSLKPGTRMDDGTTYVGISPINGRPFYTTRLKNTEDPITFRHAREIAETCDYYGHKDWRIPARSELQLLFNEFAAVGDFDRPADFYWTATETRDNALQMRRSPHFVGFYDKKSLGSLRLVRG